MSRSSSGGRCSFNDFYYSHYEHILARFRYSPTPAAQAVRKNESIISINRVEHLFSLLCFFFILCRRWCRRFCSSRMAQYDAITGFCSATKEYCPPGPGNEYITRRYLNMRGVTSNLFTVNEVIIIFYFFVACHKTAGIPGQPGLKGPRGGNSMLLIYLPFSCAFQ